ncbi:hypothetical protein HK405_013117 [Cladochytrium tenue]|nr:hypothetical protein HK405_013117 [Cladochytrium tenue]
MATVATPFDRDRGYNVGSTAGHDVGAPADPDLPLVDEFYSPSAGSGAFDYDGANGDLASAYDEFDDQFNEPIDYGLVYALHTFVANLDGQVCVLKGDGLDLMDDSNSYWWLVKCIKTEEIGYIPAENVETPFERLARLNKIRNVHVTLVTPEDSSAAGSAVGRPSTERQNRWLTFSQTNRVLSFETEEDNYDDDDEPLEEDGGGGGLDDDPEAHIEFAEYEVPMVFHDEVAAAAATATAAKPEAEPEAPPPAAEAVEPVEPAPNTDALNSLLKSKSNLGTLRIGGKLLQNVLRIKKNEEKVDVGPQAGSKISLGNFPPRSSRRRSPFQRSSRDASDSEDNEPQYSSRRSTSGRFSADSVPQAIDPINVLRIYAGNVDLEATHKAIAIHKDMTFRQLLETALRRFRVLDANPDEYYLSVVHMDSQERALAEDGNVLEVLDALQHKSLPGISAARVSRAMSVSGRMMSVLMNDDKIIRVLINRRLNMFENDYHVVRVVMYDDNEGGAARPKSTSLRHYKTVAVKEDMPIANFALLTASRFGRAGGNADPSPRFVLSTVRSGMEVVRRPDESILAVLAEAAAFPVETEFVLRRDRSAFPIAPSDIPRGFGWATPPSIQQQQQQQQQQQMPMQPVVLAPQIGTPIQPFQQQMQLHHQLNQHPQQSQLLHQQPNAPLLLPVAQPARDVQPLVPPFQNSSNFANSLNGITYQQPSPNSGSAFNVPTPSSQLDFPLHPSLNPTASTDTWLQPQQPPPPQQQQQPTADALTPSHDTALVPPVATIATAPPRLSSSMLSRSSRHRSTSWSTAGGSGAGKPGSAADLAKSAQQLMDEYLSEVMRPSVDAVRLDALESLLGRVAPDHVFPADPFDALFYTGDAGGGDETPGKSPTRGVPPPLPPPPPDAGGLRPPQRKSSLGNAALLDAIESLERDLDHGLLQVTAATAVGGELGGGSGGGGGGVAQRPPPAPASALRSSRSAEFVLSSMQRNLDHLVLSAVTMYAPSSSSSDSGQPGMRPLLPLVAD